MPFFENINKGKRKGRKKLLTFYDEVVTPSGTRRKVDWKPIVFLLIALMVGAIIGYFLFRAPDINTAMRKNPASTIDKGQISESEPVAQSESPTKIPAQSQPKANTQPTNNTSGNTSGSGSGSSVQGGSIPDSTLKNDFKFKFEGPPELKFTLEKFTAKPIDGFTVIGKLENVSEKDSIHIIEIGFFVDGEQRARWPSVYPGPLWKEGTVKPGGILSIQRLGFYPILTGTEQIMVKVVQYKKVGTTYSPSPAPTTTKADNSSVEEEKAKIKEVVIGYYVSMINGDYNKFLTYASASEIKQFPKDKFEKETSSPEVQELKKIFQSIQVIDIEINGNYATTEVTLYFKSPLSFNDNKTTINGRNDLLKENKQWKVEG